MHRRFPVGAEPTEGGFHFRVWAPDHERVDLVLESGPRAGTVALRREESGYFSVHVPGVRAGDLYRFAPGGKGPFPDPASRFQPEGPHGPSAAVDASAFRWTDAEWPGASLRGEVLYEMHVGTFTPEGTWAAAARELPELASAGISCVEVLPVSEFPGRFGWGYDGVLPFAPTRLYGTPDDFRRFVDAAHSVGIGVILDVVYNHLGPDGNCLGQFAHSYFTDRYKTDWGAAINFDGPDAGPVREYFLANAGYWIEEYHLDGLRLDATQNVYDASDVHILAEIGERVRTAARGKATILVAENEPQHPHLVRPRKRGGYGLDCLWNDDYHHAAVVALTGRAEAYYSDYRGDPQELISAVKYGYLYQGQWYSWQERRRGRPGLDLPLSAFVTFLENHDQVANSGRGLRMHQRTSPGRYRAMSSLTLLAPGTPMLFQGQEFAASTPFLYFADHTPELAVLVENGRKEFLSQFPSLSDPAAQSGIAKPHDPETFARCKLDFSEREKHATAYRLTKDLLTLRRSDPAFAAQQPRGVDGAVLGPQAFVLRFFGPDGPEGDRLLIVNLGRAVDLRTCPEPLLAPPADCRWVVRLSTDDPAYGGEGAAAPETSEAGWQLPAESACVLIPEPAPDEHAKEIPDER